MGSPRRNRKKYIRPTAIWNKQRIEEEHKIKENYGLKNLSELWRATSEIHKVRKNVREVLSGKASEDIGRSIVARLARYNIVRSDAILDDLLLIRPEAILDRRLQTVVAKRGMAKTYKQARQLITHGFIAINGRRVKSPGYMVSIMEEQGISYYKPIDINAGVQAEGAQPATENAEAPAESAETATESTESGEAENKENN